MEEREKEQVCSLAKNVTTALSMTPQNSCSLPYTAAKHEVHSIFPVEAQGGGETKHSGVKRSITQSQITRKSISSSTDQIDLRALYTRPFDLE